MKSPKPACRRAFRLVSAVLAAGTCLLASATVLTGPAFGSDPSSLVGTFRIAGGACNPATHAVSGSYFRLIYPKGNVHTGFFFQNTSSACFDKSYTTVTAGTQAGLVTGAFQPGPRPAFSRNGSARARSIIRPVSFAGVNLSLSTQSNDLQTRRSVPTPSITVSGSRVTGNLEAMSATWKWININQGSPKPGGGRPGLTSPVSGHYNQKTRRYSMTWTSQIVQGPFVGFIGEWHLEGVFVPSR
jgi:hypothetical protein